MLCIMIGDKGGASRDERVQTDNGKAILIYTIWSPSHLPSVDAPRVRMCSRALG